MVDRTATGFAIEQGQLVCYRTYDAAEQFHLERARVALREQTVAPAGFRRVRPANLEVANPPLLVRMGTVTLSAGGLDLHGEVLVRVFDTGVVSVGFWLQLPAGLPLEGLSGPSAAVMDNPALDELAEGHVRRLTQSLGDAAVKPRNNFRVMEEYTVMVVSRLHPQPADAQVLLAEPVLAQLLLGESPTGPALSAASRQGALRHALSYFGDDLVVVDWNASFVFDPRGGEDVADILEFATQQLVEFRYYDGYLDEQLARIYDEIELRVTRRLGVLGGRFTALAKDLLLLRVELTEVTEKIDNSLKLTGEPFLARVYLAAVDRLRIPQWRVSVEEKLHVVDNLVSLLRGESHSGKSIALELAVVLLIIVEIVMGLWEMFHAA